MLFSQYCILSAEAGDDGILSPPVSEIKLYDHANVSHQGEYNTKEPFNVHSSVGSH
jgi:hypothetical protein